jgi:hypothetical protein
MNRRGFLFSALLSPFLAKAVTQQPSPMPRVITQGEAMRALQRQLDEIALGMEEYYRRKEHELPPNQP